MLEQEHIDFLTKVRSNYTLPAATNEQDKVRRRLRKLGMVEFDRGFWKWRLTPKGEDALTKRGL